MQASVFFRNRLIRRLSGMGALLGLVVLTGCASHKISQYVAPRITGRVLDGETKRPLASVQIRKASGQQRLTADDSLSASQAMQRRDEERTGADGRFAIASQRDLVFLRDNTWFSVTLSFRRSGYQDAFLTYTVTNAVKTAGGEPLIETGDVLLFPVRTPVEP